MPSDEIFVIRMTSGQENDRFDGSRENFIWGGLSVPFGHYGFRFGQVVVSVGIAWPVSGELWAAPPPAADEVDTYMEGILAALNLYRNLLHLN